MPINGQSAYEPNFTNSDMNRPAQAARRSSRQIFWIGTVCYAEGLWRMRRHGPVVEHWESLPNRAITGLCLRMRHRPSA